MSGPRRIAIYGPSGAGKSTLARQAGVALGLPVVELDAIYHSRPNWDDISEEEFRERVGAVMAEMPDGWVVDGNYSMVRDLVLPQADTAVWLRLPFHVVYPRLVWRTLSRMVSGELLWGVNRESFRNGFFSRDSILLWGLTNWRPHRRKTRVALREARANGTRIVVLKSPGAVARWRESLAQPGGTGDVAGEG